MWPHHSPNVNILQIPQILNRSDIPRLHGRQTVTDIQLHHRLEDPFFSRAYAISSFTPSCASNVNGIDGVGPMLKCTNNSPLVIPWMVRSTIQTLISVHGIPKHCSRNEPTLIWMMLNAYIQKWELLSDSLSVVNWMLASMSLSVQETPVTV